MIFVKSLELVEQTLLFLLGGFDRIHKDCMHSSVYSYLNIATQSVTTVSGTPTYTLSGNIRRLLGVYDRTRNRILFNIDRVTSPVTQAEKNEPGPGQVSATQGKWTYPPLGALALQTAQPDFFRLIPSNTLVLYPTPSQVLTLTVATESQVTTLVNGTDALTIPDDGRDMVVAGVNYLANMFLKRAEDAQAWLQIYERLKMGAQLI